MPVEHTMYPENECHFCHQRYPSNQYHVCAGFCGWCLSAPCQCAADERQNRARLLAPDLDDLQMSLSKRDMAEIIKLRARIAELEAQLTPIPFSERTPDRYGTFMFYSRAGWWSSAWYSDITQEIILREYTHWLPLPPAPEDNA